MYYFLFEYEIDRLQPKLYFWILAQLHVAQNFTKIKFRYNQIKKMYKL